MDLQLNANIPANGIPATGYYDAPTNITGYDTTNDVTTTPYNQTLIGDCEKNVVGTSTNPYLPAILPVYIPTLYENVYSIQTNLVSNLEGQYANDRQYPTAYAVKNYVASQLSGFEAIEQGQISTSKTTSILKATSNTSVSETDLGNGVVVKKYSYIINEIDTARNGAEKIIICNAALSNTATMSLSTSNGALFYALGKTYTNYQFATQGDMVSMIQFIDTSTGKHSFMVKSFGGRFYN